MTETTKLVCLPKTLAAIRENFPGKGNAGLREELLLSCRYGSVPHRRWALTACGEASLEAVARVLAEERKELGFDRYVVGPSGPECNAPIVAYLDQPLY